MNILLAEDDMDIRQVAVMSLTRIGHHVVTTASNGEEILDILKQSKDFDLILLDVMMPMIDGFEVCRRLKADPTTTGIPVIFLTAKAQTHEHQLGLSLGAIGYIIKPFDPMILSKQILSIVESATHEAEQS